MLDRLKYIDSQLKTISSSEHSTTRLIQLVTELTQTLIQNNQPKQPASPVIEKKEEKQPKVAEKKE